MERTLIGVRRDATELVEALERRAEDVIEHEQVIVAGVLGGLRVVLDHRGIRADLRLREYDAESHSVSSPPWARAPSDAASDSMSRRFDTVGDHQYGAHVSPGIQGQYRACTAPRQEPPRLREDPPRDGREPAQTLMNT